MTSSTRHYSHHTRKQWNTVKTSSNPLLMSSKEKKSGKSNKSSANGTLAEENGYNTWSDGRAILQPTTSGSTRRTWPLKILLGSSSKETKMPRSNARLGATGLGQPRWTSTVQKSHLPGKPLWNLRTRTSWQHGLGPREHTGCKPWTQRSALELTGLSYWLGQQSPSRRNTEDSRGSYGAASSIWYTDWHGSKGSSRSTPRISRQKILGSSIAWSNVSGLSTANFSRL